MLMLAPPHMSGDYEPIFGQALNNKNRVSTVGLVEMFRSVAPFSKRATYTPVQLLHDSLLFFIRLFFFFFFAAYTPEQLYCPKNIVFLY